MTNIYQLFLCIITISENRMDLPRKQIIGLKKVVKITNYFFLATRIKVCQELSPVEYPDMTPLLHHTHSAKLPPVYDHCKLCLSLIAYLGKKENIEQTWREFGYRSHLYRGISEQTPPMDPSIVGFLKARPYIAQESAKRMAHSLVISQIDYCNGMLINIPKSQIHEIQVIIKRNTPDVNVTASLKDLHWLPVDDM